ncbi:LysR family transcriptional regulator [Klebsiella pneumoniae]|nr:LysR family transcriptional regulator [Klebsiella pneumoniae]
MHKTTLEQWALLEKVVELGSFARAAEETNRSQSSVSYNLALLQERLGVALLQAFAYVETHAATLRNGARTRLDLVVDSIFPRQRLFAILRQFQQRYPQT